ncbi:MAG: DUF4256 domain-containing protein [Ignavibacteriaceae bacterium]|nr:DUF4256 domain-containing protein [Ignavibacteriaceae bacterium]
MKNGDYKGVSPDEREKFFITLQNRFEKNMHRHINITWSMVQEKLEKEHNKLWSLHQMELTGGEPDVTGYDQNTGVITFCDCSPESPAGRRSLCYDTGALLQRKENKPKNSAIEMALEMGIDILDEAQYFELQKLDKFDTKTSSWLKTPSEIRGLGGAIFGDYRFGRVFVYHNGAESYYAARGFRGILKV